jgi:hypothetical protein
MQWTDLFASAGNRAQTFIGCVLGVVAVLALLSFVAIIWMRVTAIRRNGVNPLPVAAATAAAASIAVGMTIQAVVPATMILNGLPEPSAAILRVMENIAPALVQGGGMLALTLAIASLAVQACRRWPPAYRRAQPCIRHCRRPRFRQRDCNGGWRRRDKRNVSETGSYEKS